MELISFILSAIACVGLFSAGLFLRSFLPAYSAEKAKSLASKEDLAHLTTLVEGVKAAHAADIERLIVLAMRKDVGFPDTSVQAASYQFFQFL